MVHHRALAGCVVSAALVAACGGPPPPTGPTTPTPPLSASAGSSISLLAGAPAPGSELVMTDLAGLLMLRDLNLRLAVRSATDLPDAKLEVDLLDERGQRCHYSFVDRAVPANQPVVVDVKDIVVWDSTVCPAFPMTIAAVKATLLTLREPVVNGRLQRTDYAVESFPTSFTIQRWPPPPANPAPAAPVIADLSWKGFMAQPPDPPLPGDPVTVACKATESDGAPLTVSISVIWDGFATPDAFSPTFPAGASSSPQGAVAMFGLVARAMHGVATCVAVNTRGETATRAIHIGR